jgi:thiol-disulfide isomerase/thioredoxin
MVFQKLNSFFVLLFCTFLYISGAAQVQFVSSFDEAIFLSRRTQRPIMVFFTTKYCDQCKDLDQILMKDSLVSQIYNQNFINLKIEESSKNLVYLDKFLVEAFPTISFIKPNQQSFHSVRGLGSAEDLKGNAAYAVELYTGYMDFMMDLDTVTTSSALNLLMIDYVRFNPNDDIIEILNEAASKSPRLKAKLFEAIPEKLNYRNLYSVFIEDNSVFFTNDKLRDALIYSLYRGNRKPLNKKNVKDLSDYFLRLGFTNVEESVSYIKILESFEEQIIATKFDQEFSFSLSNLKDFIMTYPHCHDKKVTSECVKMLAYRYKSKSYYQSVYKVVKDKLIETPNDFMLYDIMSVCQYINGQKEVAIKTLIKANELAYQSNISYSPSLKVLRD